jgi:hypothetical protein
MVYAEALDPSILIEALERGDFYASSGVTLSELNMSKNTLSIEVKEETGVNYTIEFIGVVKGSGQSTVLKRTTGTKGKFKLTSRYDFVRARISSDKTKPNPYKEGEFEMAWTQPVMFEQ